MKKIISRKGHGVIEAAYIPLVAAAPELFDFKYDNAARLLCRVQAASALLSGLFTRAEWGLVKVVPFKTHLTIDIGMGAFSLAAPWLFGFSKNTKARNLFLAMGASAIMASLLTEHDEMPIDE